MATPVVEALQKIATETGGEVLGGQQSTLPQQLASALGWAAGSARLESLETRADDRPLIITRGFLGPQPAAIFAADGANNTNQLARDAALYAYHSSVHWGMLATQTGAIVFNSHWIRNGDWFRLPESFWPDIDENLELLTALTPEGVSDGSLDRLAANIFQPEQFLTPVDDALVARLDRWRREALRYGRNAEDLDEDLHELFAQFFVLRAVEDRMLKPSIPRLEHVLTSSDQVDVSKLRDLFQQARDSIQSELFAEDRLNRFPEFVLAGIINDLYTPRELPVGSQRYNFAWIDADVLGRAYEKYLANVFMTAPVAPQLRLFDQPTREIEPISVKKAGGIFYTPEYLVGSLSEQAIKGALTNSKDPEHIPHVIDFSCGSGSFLVEAVNILVRHLRPRDPDRNWARVLIEGKHVVGIDIDPRAVALSKMNLWIRLTDEPEALPLPSIENVVINGDSLADEVWAELPESYDVILGNPPFVATGHIRSREDLVETFQTAQGRFDYSHLFVELAVRRLVPGGVLGMVVPNRLFRNRDAGIIRSILTHETDLLWVIDFGSNEVFKGTSGYIGALVARKRTSPEALRLEHLRAALVTSVSDTRYLGGVLANSLNASGEFDHDLVKAFDITIPVGAGPWILLSPESRRTRMALEQDSRLLGEIAGIFQGIRTGANDVFILRIESTEGTFAQVVNGFGQSSIIEMSLLRPVVYGSDIQRYDTPRPQQYLLYPYVGGVALSDHEFQESFPKGFAYLFANQHLLANRSGISTSGIKWFELVRRRAESWLSLPKLLTRDLAIRTSFSLDGTGQLFLVGGTAVVPQDPDMLLPLLGYLNSKTASDYLVELTPAFRGAFQKFEPQHLNQLPVPNFIVDLDSLAQQLGDLAQVIVDAHSYGNEAAGLEAEMQIDQLLEEL